MARKLDKTVFMMVRFMVVAALFATTLGCGKPEPAEPAISMPATLKVNERIRLALNALPENMRDSDYTAVLQVSDRRIEDTVTSDLDEFIAVRYTATVLETFVGPQLEQVEFIAYEERDEFDETAAIDSTPFIYSLCKNENDVYYVPDVGYQLPLHSALVKEARAIAVTFADSDE